MKTILRGPLVARLLRGLGIHPKRYWLLIDLFQQLTDSHEVMGQLGRDGVSLKTLSYVYFGLSSIISLMLMAAHPPLIAFVGVAIAMGTFILLSVLLFEANNSLVNPEEGLILAHQPINGATYTAAKLSHLLRILLYFIPGLNIVPAVAGLYWEESSWYFPLLFLLAAFAIGVVLALSCCALFGWLIRFLPPARLKNVGQFAQMLPVLLMMVPQSGVKVLKKIGFARLVPDSPQIRYALIAALLLAAAAVIAYGLRSLSGDYLVRVSSIAHGGSTAKTALRKSILSDIVGRFFGGPAGRAGFAFVARMMRRDWQFRRQLIGLIPMLIISGGLIARETRTPPFNGEFTGMHVLPHFFGLLLFLVTSMMPYGTDYKGSWVFLLAPSHSIESFARGVHAQLWLVFIVIPHLFLLGLLAWLWGPADAAIFVAYSLAVASTYLGMELPLVEGVPYCAQPDPARGHMMFATMMFGGLGMAIAVGVQYFVIFHSRTVVLGATAVLGVVAWRLTRESLQSFTTSMRFRLGQSSTETGTLYTEII